MKKKILVACLCVALAVLTIAGTTLAYLTSTKEVKNTFTVGSVAINLDEALVNTDGKPVDKDGNVVTDLAAAKRVTGNSYKLMPNHTYTKDPTVTVLDGSEASYVRMKVTFNKASALIAMCTDPKFAEDGPTGVENAYPLIRMVKFVEANAAKWDGIIPDNMDETEEMLGNAKYFAYDKAADTLTYYYYYTETVAAPDSNVVLPVLFDKITVPDWATGDQLAKLEGFEINVVANAIQADGFADADEAWAAFPTK